MHNNREELMQYRLDMAKERLESSKLLLEKAEEQGNLRKINIDDHLKAAFTGNNDVLIPYLKGKNSFDEKEFRVVLACAASDDTEAVREYLKNNDIDHASRDGVTLLEPQVSGAWQGRKPQNTEVSAGSRGCRHTEKV